MITADEAHQVAKRVREERQPRQEAMAMETLDERCARLLEDVEAKILEAARDGKTDVTIKSTDLFERRFLDRYADMGREYADPAAVMKRLDEVENVLWDAGYAVHGHMHEGREVETWTAWVMWTEYTEEERQKIRAKGFYVPGRLLT